MEERYHGNLLLAGFVGLLGVALLALAVFVIGQAFAQPVTADLLTRSAGALGLIALLGTGVLFLYVARVHSATYLVDDHGITRRIPGRATTIAWPDLDRFEETHSTESGAAGRYMLFARDGRRLDVFISVLTDGARLRTRLEKQLQPLRERKLRDLADWGRRWRPHRTLGLFVLGFIAPMSVIIGCATLAQVHAAVSTTTAMFLGGLLLAAGLVLAVLGAELVSRVLTVSDSGIALRSLFVDRWISLDRVQSITLCLVGDEPQVEYARIRGDNRSISIHSDMPGYRELLELVCSHGKIEPVRVANLAQWTGITGRGLVATTASALGPAFMGLGLVLILIGGWQLFTDRTATSDRPAAVKIGSGAALLLAFVALAIVSHEIRSSTKAREPE
jgi:hypothetical protein